MLNPPRRNVLSRFCESSANMLSKLVWSQRWHRGVLKCGLVVRSTILCWQTVEEYFWIPPLLFLPIKNKLLLLFIQMVFKVFTKSRSAKLLGVHYIDRAGTLVIHTRRFSSLLCKMSWLTTVLFHIHRRLFVLFISCDGGIDPLTFKVNWGVEG